MGIPTLFSVQILIADDESHLGLSASTLIGETDLQLHLMFRAKTGSDEWEDGALILPNFSPALDLEHLKPIGHFLDNLKEPDRGTIDDFLFGLAETNSNEIYQIASPECEEFGEAFHIDADSMREDVRAMCSYFNAPLKVRYPPEWEMIYGDQFMNLMH